MTALPDVKTMSDAVFHDMRVHRTRRDRSAVARSLCIVALTGGAAASAFAAGAGTEGRMILLAGGAFLACLWAFGSLPGFGLHPEARLRKAVQAWFASLCIALISALVLADPHTDEITRFVLAFLALAIAQAVCGRILRTILRRSGHWGEAVHLAGDPARVAGLRSWLHANPDTGLDPDPDSRAVKVLWADAAAPSPEQLERLARTYSQVVLVHDLPRTTMTGIHPAWQDGAIGTQITLARRDGISRWIKRGIDLAVVIPVGIVALPIVALAALAVRMVDPGPAFHVQHRDGRDGRPFAMLKLRTMYLDADRMLARLIETDPAIREEWETHFKLRHDPRVLPVIGPFLRTSSLDELPQLLNILRGEMSLVGPRPFPDYHLSAMPADFRARRATVTPGLTGLWQISERGDADLGVQQQLDDFYISGRSLWGDLSIFLRTFSAVLGRGGAF